MDTPSSFIRLCRFSIFSRPAVLLVALAWSDVCVSSKLAAQERTLTPTLSRTIFEAIQRDDLEKVKALVKDNPDLVSSKDDSLGKTPLHWAAEYGFKDVAQLLLVNGAKINAKDGFGDAPLEDAVGHADMEKFLLANNADVHATNSRGQTPLHVAAYYDSTEVAELFLAGKADVNARDKDGDTPLLVAAGHGDTKMTKCLLGHKADVNARDNRGETPLHAAAGECADSMPTENKHKEVVQLLLASKAEVNARDNDGRTPLHVAVTGGIKEVTKLLLANKADVNAKDNNGHTPLYEVSRFLSSLGLSTDFEAQRHDLEDVIKLLRQHGGHE
jgi:ankyrin repeat protein